MDLGEQGQRVKFMIRDRGSNYTAAFDAVLAGAGIRTVLCNVRTPRMNAIAERWIGGCRRELLDRTLIPSLTVAVDRQGAVCTLSVSGDLDFTPAECLTQQAACLDATIGQLVLDLSLLRFADCFRARALEPVTRAVPRRLPGNNAIDPARTAPGLRHLAMDLGRRRDPPASDRRTR
jgi:hypothetical protein